MPSFIIISGCSGGGKSTLIAALREAGETVIEEPGRRVIAAERARGGNALPWTDMTAFVRRIVTCAQSDLDEVRKRSGRVFLDRGLIDAAVALEHLTGIAAEQTIDKQRFYRTVFLAPPWPELYVADEDRHHDFGVAVAEYERLATAYPRLGHDIRLLPKRSVAERRNFILREVSSA